ncbi:MAG: hypothetical protein JXK94_03795 [Deltaproteobacteria bacterium]|nr:hypothetical protein [Deltaproteobacteria bacterium]
MKNRIVHFGIVFCLLLSSLSFAQMNPGTDVESLKESLDSTSRAQRVYAAKIISRSGLTDEALYEKIATILKENYASSSSPNDVDEMAWLCKALAASGNPDYRPLLDEIGKNAKNTKLQHYAKQSSGMIEEFARRKEILNAQENWDDSLSAEDNRLLNMLTSENISLKRDAAKSLVRHPGSDIKVYDAAADALKHMADNFTGSNLYVDTMAWLCKALAASGDIKFIDNLQQIESTTKNAKLQNYAKRARRSLK